MIKLEIKAWTISPFGGGWGVEKQPKVHPLPPPKGETVLVLISDLIMYLFDCKMTIN